MQARRDVAGLGASRSNASIPTVSQQNQKYRIRHTVLCQRNTGTAPISFARLAQVVGPTYALTAAFMTRVGRCGYAALTYSDAKSPSSEFPSVAREAFVAGSVSPGCCWV